MSEEDKRLSQRTLTQFIESNHKLISTLAVFATLSVFANNLPDKDTGRILSFCLFTLALVIGIEVVMNFAPINGGRLHWFQELFALSILGFVIAWVRTFYPLLIFLLFAALGLVAILTLFALFKKAIRGTVSRMSWLKNKSQRTREDLVPMFGAMLLMTLVAMILRYLKLI